MTVCLDITQCVYYTRATIISVFQNASHALLGLSTNLTQLNAVPKIRALHDFSGKRTDSLSNYC